jgi:hypothetical protein
MESVTLTDVEMLTCRAIGNVKTLCNRSLHVKDNARGKMKNWEIDEYGVFGEYAFCKLNNIFFDASAGPRSGTCDFVYMGHRFDMKTTPLASGRLLLMPKENIDVDFYALAIITGNTVTFPGYCKKSELRDEANATDLGYGKVYALPQSALRKWKTNEKGKDNSEGTG